MVRCQASIKQHIDINVMVSNGDDILIHHIDNKDSLRYGIYGLQWVIHAQYYLFPGSTIVLMVESKSSWKETLSSCPVWWLHAIYITEVGDISMSY